jgi:hypothetical protein
MLYEKHHKHAIEGLLEDTGKWLLDKPEFREWQLSSTSGVLWLHGIREPIATTLFKKDVADEVHSWSWKN